MIKEFLLENIYPKQIVLKNTFWLSISNILSKLCKLIVIFIAARILGPSTYGSFSYTLSLLGLLFIFADFGLSNIIIRDYQQKENKEELLRSSYLLKILLITSISLIAILSFLFLKNYEVKKVYFILLLFFILDHLKSFFNSILSALQRMEKNSIIELSENFFTLLAGIILLLNFKSINSLGFSYLIGGIIAFVLSVYFLKVFNIKLKPEINLKVIKYLFINGLPLMLFGFLNYIFFTTDQLILGYFRTMREVGYYSVVSKILLNILIFPSLFLFALFPYLASQIQNIEKVRLITKKVMLILIFSAMFLSLILYILAPYLTLILGNEYYQSVIILRYFVWILIFTFPTVLLDYVLFAYNKQWQDFFITSFAALLNLTLNFIAIPLYGVYGAVFSSIISQIVNLLLSLILVYNILKL